MTAPSITDAVMPTVMKDEGFRRTPYRCPRGHLTIGYGTNLDAGLDDEEAMFLLEHRLNKAVGGCTQAFPWFPDLDRARQGVIAMMAYQLGVPGVAKFTEMCAALARKDYWAAADAMLDSKWHREDSPERAMRLAVIMRTAPTALRP